MLAVIKENKNSDFVIKKIEIPKPKKNEVLIKVKSVGICGTDVYIFKGIQNVSYPIVPGHEFSGIIVEVGDSVKNFNKGDHVLPGIVANCGKCIYCKQGLESLCDNIYEIGISGNGGFAEYAIVPEKVLHLLPKNMSFNQGASVEPIAAAYHSIMKSNITNKDTVAVFGPGPIGLYALQIARIEGARRIIVVGTEGDENRLNIASLLGADLVVNCNKEDINTKIKEYTQGKMVDVVVEATGVPGTVETCLKVLCKNGRLCLTGIFHQPSSFLTLSNIVRKEIRIKGSYCYTWQDFENCIYLVNSGRIEVEPIITHEFPLRSFPIALESVYSRKSIKTILHPGE